MKRSIASVLLILSGFASNGAIGCSAAPSNGGADEIDGVSASASTLPGPGNDDQCTPEDCPGYKPHPPGYKPPPLPTGPGAGGGGSQRCGTPFGACCYSSTGQGYCTYSGVTCQSGTCQQCGGLGDRPCIATGCSAGVPIDGTCQVCTGQSISPVQTSDTSETITVTSTGAVSSLVVFTNLANPNDTSRVWGPIGTSVPFTFKVTPGASYSVTVTEGGPSSNCAPLSTTVKIPGCGQSGQFSCGGVCTTGKLDVKNACGDCGREGGTACAGNVCNSPLDIPSNGVCINDPSCGGFNQHCCASSCDSVVLTCNGYDTCVSRDSGGGSGGGGTGGGGGSGGGSGLGLCTGGQAPADHYACVVCSGSLPETRTLFACSDQIVADEITQQTGCRASPGACSN